MLQLVRLFTHACNLCLGSRPLRQLHQGLLKPIPLADHFWTQISVDFITDLPAAEGSPRYLMVLTDRLSKWIQLEAMYSISAEEYTVWFRDA